MKAQMSLPKKTAIVAYCVNAATVILLLLGTAACLKTGGSRLATNAEATQLTLKGTVSLANGSPAMGAKILADEIDDSLGVTNQDGSFRITLSEDQLTRLATVASAGGPSGGRNTFRLWLEGADGEATVGLSDGIEVARRGELQLANITLQGTGSISGKVMVVSSGRRPEDGVGATIRIGRRSVTADPTGSFVLDKLPAGLHTLRTSFNRYETDLRSVNLGPGENRALTTEIVLFPENTIGGAVFINEPQRMGELVATGHPFLRSFRAVGSTKARYIRYYHDETALTSGAIAPWRPIPEKFEHDFLADGGNTLYYQFADDSKEDLSEIYRIQVVIDQFANSTGCRIEDGSGMVFQRQVLVHMDVPPSAFRMRLAESVEQLLERPWEDAAPLTTHSFELRRNAESLQFEIEGLRLLFCQFRDANGLDGPVFQTSAIVNLFPIEGVPFTMDNDAPESLDRTVRLDIKVPPNAREMRIFENILQGAVSAFDISATGAAFGATSITNLQDKLWMAALPVYYKVFPVQGPKGLYLQFRTGEGAVSPIYKKTILILPFPGSADEGFVINNNEPTSPTRHLNITLVPPVNAYQWRIGRQPDLNRQFEYELAEIVDNIENNSWRTLVPSATYSVLTPGEKVIAVQYRDAELNQSGIYTRTVLVMPFPPEVGRVVINNGEAITPSRTVLLNITPPPNAVAMWVRERIPGFNYNSSPIWQALSSPLAFTLSPDVGAKTIEVVFRNPSLDASAAISATVFYDPFPLTGPYVVINNGAPVTTSSNVILNLTIPTSARAMRLANSTLELESLPFITPVTTTTWTLAGTLGPQKVYVQFQTPEGDESPMYFDEIELILPPTSTSTATTTTTSTSSTTTTSATVETSTSTSSTTSTDSATSTATSTSSSTSTGP